MRDRSRMSGQGVPDGDQAFELEVDEWGENETHFTSLSPRAMRTLVDGGQGRLAAECYSTLPYEESLRKRAREDGRHEDEPDGIGELRALLEGLKRRPAAVFA